MECCMCSETQRLNKRRFFFPLKSAFNIRIWRKKFKESSSASGEYPKQNTPCFNHFLTLISPQQRKQFEKCSPSVVAAYYKKHRDVCRTTRINELLVEWMDYRSQHCPGEAITSDMVLHKASEVAFLLKTRVFPNGFGWLQQFNKYLEENSTEIYAESANEKVVPDQINISPTPLAASTSYAYKPNLPIAMTICAVFGCDSSNDKRLVRNKSKTPIELKFFRFPRDIAMRNVWEISCGRKPTSDIVSHLSICSKHFTPDAYARNLRHELLNYKPRNSKHLKEDAIPTLFMPNPTPTANRVNVLNGKSNSTQNPSKSAAETDGDNGQPDCILLPSQPNAERINTIDLTCDDDAPPTQKSTMPIPEASKSPSLVYPIAEKAKVVNLGPCISIQLNPETEKNKPKTSVQRVYGPIVSTDKPTDKAADLKKVYNLGPAVSIKIKHPSEAAIPSLPKPYGQASVIPAPGYEMDKSTLPTSLSEASLSKELYPTYTFPVESVTSPYSTGPKLGSSLVIRPISKELISPSSLNTSQAVPVDLHTNSTFLNIASTSSSVVGEQIFPIQSIPLLYTVEPRENIQRTDLSPLLISNPVSLNPFAVNQSNCSPSSSALPNTTAKIRSTKLLDKNNARSKPKKRVRPYAKSVPTIIQHKSSINTNLEVIPTPPKTVTPAYTTDNYAWNNSISEPQTQADKSLSEVIRLPGLTFNVEKSVLGAKILFNFLDHVMLTWLNRCRSGDRKIVMPDLLLKKKAKFVASILNLEIQNPSWLEAFKKIIKAHDDIVPAKKVPRPEVKSLNIVQIISDEWPKFQSSLEIVSKDVVDLTDVPSTIPVEMEVEKPNDPVDNHEACSETLQSFTEKETVSDDDLFAEPIRFRTYEEAIIHLQKPSSVDDSSTEIIQICEETLEDSSFHEGDLANTLQTEEAETLDLREPSEYEEIFSQPIQSYNEAFECLKLVEEYAINVQNTTAAGIIAKMELLLKEQSVDIE